MPQPPLPRALAREAVRLVEAALQAGHPLHAGRGHPGAGTAGFQQYLADNPGSTLSVSAFVNRLRTAKRLYAIEPKLPKNPAKLPPRERITAPQIGGTPLDAKVVALQDEVHRLTRIVRDNHRAANDDDLVREVIGRIAGEPRRPPPWLSTVSKRAFGKPDPEVPVVCWADWHLGERIERNEVLGFNEYNMAVAAERVHRLFDQTIHLARDHHTGIYPGIVINSVGDMVSGGLHPELAKTDEVDPPEAACTAIDFVHHGLRQMKGAFGQVYVPWVCGNHGRMTAKPEFKKYNKKNWDYLIGRMVQKLFADDPDVHIDIRDSNDVYYQVFSQRYLLVHGDMLAVKGGDGIIGSIGPVMRGEVKKSGQSSSLGQHFDKLILGHFHQRLWLPRSTVSGCLKGWDEYARLQVGAKPDVPTQALWFVHPRRETAHWDIEVDEQPAQTVTAPWVSVFAPPARASSNKPERMAA